MPVRPLTHPVGGALLAAAATTAGLCAATLGAAGAGAVAHHHHAPKAYTVFGGGAYGSTATVGSVAHSGRTAYVPQCTRTLGHQRSDHTAALDLPGLGSIGAVTTRIGSQHYGSGVAAQARSSTAATTLLAGLVHATALRTSAIEAHVGRHYRGIGSTTLVGVTIAGRAMPQHPKVGQTVAVPGVGSVVLNQQTRSHKAGSYAMSVTALRLTVAPDNASQLPAGTVVLSHATATLHTPVHQMAYGSAFGSIAQAGSTLKSGRTAPVYLPCGGSNAARRTNATAAVHTPGLLDTGAVVSSGYSKDSSALTTAMTRSRIAKVNLLGGRIKVSAVTTQANARRNVKHQLFRSSAGTTVGSLTVNGTRRSVPKAGTSRLLRGIGRLYVARTIRSKTGITVHGLELVLTQPSGQNPAGTVLIIGSANAGVH